MRTCTFYSAKSEQFRLGVRGKAVAEGGRRRDRGGEWRRACALRSSPSRPTRGSQPSPDESSPYRERYAISITASHSYLIEVVRLRAFPIDKNDVGSARECGDLDSYAPRRLAAPAGAPTFDSRRLQLQSGRRLRPFVLSPCVPSFSRRCPFARRFRCCARSQCTRAIFPRSGASSCMSPEACTGVGTSAFRPRVPRAAPAAMCARRVPAPPPPRPFARLLDLLLLPLLPPCRVVAYSRRPP